MPNEAPLAPVSEDAYSLEQAASLYFRRAEDHYMRREWAEARTAALIGQLAAQVTLNRIASQA